MLLLLLKVYYILLANVASLVALGRIYIGIFSRDAQIEEMKSMAYGVSNQRILFKRFCDSVSIAVGVIGFFIPFAVFPFFLYNGEKETAWFYFIAYIILGIVLKDKIAKLPVLINIATHSSLIVAVVAYIYLRVLIALVDAYGPKFYSCVLIIAAWDIVRLFLSGILEIPAGDMLKTPLAYIKDRELLSSTQIITSAFVVLSFFVCLYYTVEGLI